MDYIDKSHCNLQNIPDDVLRHERYLEELLLDANQIQELPKAIFRMYKLRKLILSDNEILDLTNELGNLVALEEFDISKNDIRGVPDCIEKLKKLTYLDLSNNTLGELPDSITRLKDLRNLVVNDVALGEIPPEIGSLECLSILELRDNCIRFLPMSFSFLFNLQKLDLGGNELEELPDTIGQLTNLQELWLDGNYLTALPPEIGEISALQCLDVSENRIEELPDEIGGLTSLTLFIVSTNSLHEIPEGIGKLVNLQILKAEQNEIDDLTEEIGGCISLEELVLTDNSIEFLPAAIGSLKKLTNLNIDRNRLYTLPPEIGNCTKLTLLCARDNLIEKIPKEIGNCRSLAVLDLSGNKLENLPFIISTLPLKALWLSQNQGQSVLKLQVDDENPDEKVLTCFLFPQDKLRPSSSIDDFMKEVYGDDTENRKGWNSIPQIQSLNPGVTFDNTDEIPKEPKLTRTGTPYPKELKERHPQLIRKRSNSDDTGKGSESNRDSYQSDASESYLEKKDNGVSFVETGLTLTLDNGIDNPFIENDNIIVDSTEVVNTDQEITSTEPHFVNGHSSSDEDEDGDEDEEDGDNDDNEGNVGDDDLNKHVEFLINEDAVLDRAEDEECKLQRKDTPHHLKGKRIVNSEEDKIKLQEILLNIEKRKSDELDSDFNDQTSLDVAISKVSFQNGVANEEESEDDTDSEEKDSIGISFAYKKTTFQEPNFNEEIIAQPLEDLEPKVSQIVTADDGCELIEEETIMKLYEEITAIIQRDGPSLGINIAGGLGTTSFQDDEQLADSETRPFEDEGVFITKIAADSPAGRLSVLEIGDKIIKVNGTDISRFSHDDAVSALRHAGDVVTLVALREVTNEDEIDLSMTREEKNVRFAAEPEVEDIEIETMTIPVMLKRDAKGLGFSIAGGKSSNAYNGRGEGVYISKISEDGPAAFDKRLQLGDKIFSVNGIDVRQSSHDDVVKILTSTSETVSLLAFREHVINKKMKPASQINGSIVSKGSEQGVESVSEQLNNEEEPKLLVEEILLNRSEGPLGISVVGGCDKACHPFGVKEPGIFISKVNPNGEAAKTKICVGDRILRVNDKDMRNALHHEGVSALVSAEPELKLLVRHDPPPPGIRDLTITKKVGEKLGISIRGGAKGHPGNPLDKNDEGIFVSKVNSSGAVSRTGELKVGMRILEVNGISLLGATHVDAVRALKTAGDSLAMVVADGYDAILVEDASQEDVLYNPALCEPTRFSPDSASSATSGDSFPDETISYHDEKTMYSMDSPQLSPKDLERRGNNSVKRTPSEQRVIEADKRAKWRQERLAALDNDAKKAQAVIAQSKGYSSTSLEEGSVISEEDRSGI